MVTVPIPVEVGSFVTEILVNGIVALLVGCTIMKFAAVIVLESTLSLNTIVTFVVDVADVPAAEGMLLENVGAVVSAVILYTLLNHAVPVAAV